MPAGQLTTWCTAQRHRKEHPRLPLLLRAVLESKNKVLDNTIAGVMHQEAALRHHLASVKAEQEQATSPGGRYSLVGVARLLWFGDS
jgi:hypothetical protein